MWKGYDIPLVKGEWTKIECEDEILIAGVAEYKVQIKPSENSEGGYITMDNTTWLKIDQDVWARPINLQKVTTPIVKVWRKS